MNGPGPRVAGGPDATLVERIDLTPEIVRLRVLPDAGVPAFAPGQYVALGIETGGRLLQRPYSTASPRGETDALEFLVRLVPAGALTPLLWRLPAGSRLALGRPKGRFVPDAADPRVPVFIATGTGIAPLVSMLETRLRETADGPPRRRPILVHGVARANELAYRDRLEELAARHRITYVPAVSRPHDPANRGWRGASGRLDALVPSVLADRAVDPCDAVAFLCGNPGMVDAVGTVLRGLGMPDDALRSEAYWVRPASG